MHSCGGCTGNKGLDARGVSGFICYDVDLAILYYFQVISMIWDFRRVFNDIIKGWVLAHMGFMT